MAKMTRPRLEACYFPAKYDSRWKRLARVLETSAHRECTEWDVQVRAITPAPEQGLRAYASNTQKLESWAAQVAAAADGDRLLLIDADMVILRPIDDIWDRPFDVAYTIRPRRFPLNGGVVFLRISDRVRRLLADWTRENRRLLTEQTASDVWPQRYGGINQASLATLLPEADARGIALLQLPCAEWNCEDTTWAKFNPAVTRILHVKSALRRQALGLEPTTPELEPLVAIWRRCERQDEARTA